MSAIFIVKFCLLLTTTLAGSADNFFNEKENLLEPEWSPWSDWGSCSRTCDGGATYQTRHCLDNHKGCTGNSIRYRICNMQPCPYHLNYRLQQCRSYNNIPYQGELHSWEPHDDVDADDCALTCRSMNSSIAVQLSPRVHDGTRCKEGSLDMCIDGVCQSVGCDLQLNSELKIDACGVCGGDGSTCADVVYQWEYGRHLTPCSASCDAGEQEVELICRSLVTGALVREDLCDATTKPTNTFLSCNEDPCPPRWITEPWSPCSMTCGGGIKERRVLCIQGYNDTKVDDVICTTLIGPKPRPEEPCNTHDCPRWFEGNWSECPVTCGEGIQSRPVVCRDALGHVTNACQLDNQPEVSRVCSGSGSAHCPPTTTVPTATAPNRPARQKVTPFSLFDEDEEEQVDDDEEVEQLKTIAASTSTSRIVAVTGTNPKPSALLSERLQVGEINLIPTDPTFIVGDWTPCSATCGGGTRERDVHCKIFLEFSKTIAKLPDKECPGPKPTEIEPCFLRSCSSSTSNKYELWLGQFSDQSNREKMRNKPVEDLQTATKLELTAGGSGSSRMASQPNYQWRPSGFSQCSASCLGGVQESITECVDEASDQVVSPALCPLERRPDSITRTCNDVPCPPRWNISDFSPCSKTCGGGIQSREVHCIHEVARGGSNTLPVAAELCPQPAPRFQQYCNMIDCPIEWKAGEWTKCSATCDGGFKVRKVQCQQQLALTRAVTKASNQCLGAKPAESKACNVKACSESNRPRILSVNQTFVQNSLKRKITLKIGGSATVYKGTRVKIRCPVKHFDKLGIEWHKDHVPLVKSHKYDLNKKGMLRIQDVTYSDSGVYSCIAGRSVANITLMVRPSSIHAAIEPQRKDPLRSDGGHKLDSNQEEANKKDGVWPVLPEAGDDDPDDIIAGNSLDGGSTGRHGKFFDLKQGKSRPLDSWTREESQDVVGNEDDSLFNGPLYSDQEQELSHQAPHYTYVTRARTTRAPLPATLAYPGFDVTPTPTPHPTTPQHVYYDPEYDDDDPAPELINPVPTLWPTSNWWGYIDHMRNAEDAEQEQERDQLRLNHIEPHGKSSSSMPKPSPYFQLLLAGLQLLWPFQNHQHHQSQDEQQQKEEDKAPKKERAQKTQGRSRSRANRRRKVKNSRRTVKTNQNDRAASPFGGPNAGTTAILGKGKAEHLVFEWLVTPWSKCSQTCGGSGFQVRAAQCMVRLNNVTKSVEGGLCEDAGLDVPSAMQKCGLDICPRWEVGAWTPCQQSRCFTWNTAIQRRRLQCLMQNGTALDTVLCSEQTRPAEKRECFNENCRGTWKVSDWSEAESVKMSPITAT